MSQFNGLTSLSQHLIGMALTAGGSFAHAPQNGIAPPFPMSAYARKSASHRAKRRARSNRK